MVSEFKKEKNHWAEIEFEMQRRFEEDILSAGIELTMDAQRAKVKLARIAKQNEVPLELVDQIAQDLLAPHGIDLEEVEFSKMVEQIKKVESLLDEGVRDFKLEKLSKRFKISKNSMMNCYYKALINQTPFIDYGVEDLGKLCQSVKDWVVSGWIPQGIVLLLHAMGGAGKSLMLYELIECIAKGQPWNGYPVAQGRVLVMQSDEPVVVTSERMQIRQLTNDHPVRVVPGWQIENMARLEAYLKSYKEAGDPVRFCMIDSVTSVNRNTLISENDTEYARFMLKLNDLGDRYGCTFAVIHHSNSEGESRGTKALYNSASEVWGLTVADESSGERVLRVQKTRMGRPPGRYKFQFDEESFTFAYLGKEGDEGQEETAHTEKRIELWLNEDEHYGLPYEVEELAHHLQINKNTIRKVVKEMWNKGLISRCPKRQGRTMLYYVGTYRSNDRSIDPRSIGDHQAITSQNNAIPPSEGVNDRSIAKNDDLSLLRNPENGDRPIINPLTPALNKEKPNDRPNDRLTIAPPPIDNGDHSIAPGDIIIANTSATWFRAGSDKPPSKELPGSKKDASSIPIKSVGEVFFDELRQPSRVLEIKGDRIRVRNQVTGRNSVFAINDVQIYHKADLQS